MSIMDEIKRRRNQYNDRIGVLVEFLPLVMDTNFNELNLEKISLIYKLEELDDLIKYNNGDE